ncbi:hypothetical protein PFISCL1PPCAC_21036, partial [Pristionchus fissidentatus]
MAQWTDASRSTLIQEFQGRPILWDRRLNDINSRVSKGEALQRVTQILNESYCPTVTKQQYTVDDVKQQWKNLKDTFVRKQRWVNEGKYLRDPHEEPSWKFYRLLKFLDNSPEDASSPGSPQAGNSNDGMNSRDGHSNSSTSFLHSTSITLHRGGSIPYPYSIPMDLEGMSASSLHHHQLHSHHNHPPSTSSVNTVTSLLPLSNSLAGMDIKPSTEFLLQGDAGANLRKQGAQLSPRAPLGGVGPSALCAPTSAHHHHTPLKLADLEDTDTTTSPSSSRESHDSLTRSIVLPPSLVPSRRLRPLISSAHPVTTSLLQNSLSRSVHPGMSVENALKLSGGMGGHEPPSKKRKSYESRLSLMTMNPLSSSLLSASSSPSTGVSPRIDFTHLAAPAAAAAPAATPFMTPVSTSAAAVAGAACGSSSMASQSYGENDEWAFFGGYVGSVLRRF